MLLISNKKAALFKFISKVAFIFYQLLLCKPGSTLKKHFKIGLLVN
ncbi:hypothetical protein P20480_1385 [Pseudoalteromonas sp. BSi20480]|nr:hypothetical protein P20480_1385 [Pseudoalteromonas sp. BSi20480]